MLGRSGKNTKLRVGIIGAGPAGLAAAYYLLKNGAKVDIYEAGVTPGGLSKTLEMWGHRVDLGPHRFFTKDERILSLWNEILKDEKITVRRLTRIYYRKKFYRYPIAIFDSLKNLGLFESARCFFSYIKEKISPTKQDGTFETWVVSRFGRRLFEIFFKTYSENLWGIPCGQLDSKFAQQRIKKLSMAEAIKNALGLNSKDKHRTLIEEFSYPKKGIGQFYDMLSSRITEMGGVIKYKTPVSGVVRNDKEVTGIKLTDGQIVNYDYVISTMPVTDLFANLGDLPADVTEKLETFFYRNTILVYFLIKGENYFPDQWVYIHDPSVQFGRITNCNNWSPHTKVENETVLIMEYWCNADDKIWNIEEDELLNQARAELSATGLVDEKHVVEGKIVRIKKSYPVYYRGYEDNLKVLQDYADENLKNLILIGRNGTYKYNNQDHSILMGILAADNIINKSGHLLWQINTDDSYQEVKK